MTKRVGDVIYVIHTPDRRKTQRLCHVNMLKSYWERGEVAKVATTAPVCGHVEDVTAGEDTVSTDDVMMSSSCTLQNSDILTNLMKKLSNLSQSQQQQVSSLILEFVDLFPDTPGRTPCVHHDVDVIDATPIRQHPYRVNPVKLKYLRKEVEYMIDNAIIEPSSSEWSSPCVLVPKGNGAYRFCTDFRKEMQLPRLIRIQYPG